MATAHPHYESLLLQLRDAVALAAEASAFSFSSFKLPLPVPPAGGVPPSPTPAPSPISALEQAAAASRAGARGSALSDFHTSVPPLLHAFEACLLAGARRVPARTVRSHNTADEAPVPGCAPWQCILAIEEATRVARVSVSSDAPAPGAAAAGVEVKADAAAAAAAAAAATSATATLLTPHNLAAHVLSECDRMTSEIGLLRAYLRSALNAHLLAGCLQALFAPAATPTRVVYYESDALVQDSAACSRMLTLCSALAGLPFALFVNEPALDAGTCLPSYILPPVHSSGAAKPPPAAARAPVPSVIERGSASDALAMSLAASATLADVTPSASAASVSSSAPAPLRPRTGSVTGHAPAGADAANASMGASLPRRTALSPAHSASVAGASRSLSSAADASGSFALAPPASTSLRRRGSSSSIFGSLLSSVASSVDRVTTGILGRLGVSTTGEGDMPPGSYGPDGTGVPPTVRERAVIRMIQIMERVQASASSPTRSLRPAAHHVNHPRWLNRGVMATLFPSLVAAERSAAASDALHAIALPTTARAFLGVPLTAAIHDPRLCVHALLDATLCVPEIVHWVRGWLRRITPPQAAATPGVFVVSPPIDRVLTLAAEFDTVGDLRHMVSPECVDDVYAVASMLVYYLVTLPSSLIPAAQFEDFCATSGLAHAESATRPGGVEPGSAGSGRVATDAELVPASPRCIALRALVNSLPLPHQSTLAEVLSLLYYVSVVWPDAGRSSTPTSRPASGGGEGEAVGVSSVPPSPSFLAAAPPSPDTLMYVASLAESVAPAFARPRHVPAPAPLLPASVGSVTPSNASNASGSGGGSSSGGGGSGGGASSYTLASHVGDLCSGIAARMSAQQRNYLATAVSTCILHYQYVCADVVARRRRATLRLRATMLQLQRSHAALITPVSLSHASHVDLCTRLARASHPALEGILTLDAATDNVTNSTLWRAIGFSAPSPLPDAAQTPPIDTPSALTSTEAAYTAGVLGMAVLVYFAETYTSSWTRMVRRLHGLNTSVTCGRSRARTGSNASSDRVGSEGLLAVGVSAGDAAGGKSNASGPTTPILSGSAARLLPGRMAPQLSPLPESPSVMLDTAPASNPADASSFVARSLSSGSGSGGVGGGVSGGGGVSMVPVPRGASPMHAPSRPPATSDASFTDLPPTGSATADSASSRSRAGSVASSAAPSMLDMEADVDDGADADDSSFADDALPGWFPLAHCVLLATRRLAARCQLTGVNVRGAAAVAAAQLSHDSVHIAGTPANAKAQPADKASERNDAETGRPSLETPALDEANAVANFFSPLLVATGTPDLWALCRRYAAEPGFAVTGCLTPAASLPAATTPGFDAAHGVQFDNEEGEELSIPFLCLACVCLCILEARWVAGQATLQTLSALIDTAVEDTCALLPALCREYAGLHLELTTSADPSAQSANRAAPASPLLPIDVLATVGAWRKGALTSTSARAGGERSGQRRLSGASGVSGVSGISGGRHGVSRTLAADDMRTWAVLDGHVDVSTSTGAGTAHGNSSTLAQRRGRSVTESSSVDDVVVVDAPMSTTSVASSAATLAAELAARPAADVPRVYLDAPSDILTPWHAAVLEAVLPRNHRGYAWHLSYSLVRHGASLETLAARCRDGGPAYVVIQDDQGTVFGGFASEPWKASAHSGYFGTGQSFVYTFADRRAYDAARTAAALAEASAEAATVRQSVLGVPGHTPDAAAAVGSSMPPSASTGEVLEAADDTGSGRHFSMYKWSRNNKYFQMMNGDGIGMGGGGHFAWYLDSDLNRGASGACSTYDSPCLSAHDSFIAIHVEVWTFQRRSTFS